MLHNYRHVAGSSAFRKFNLAGNRDNRRSIVEPYVVIVLGGFGILLRKAVRVRIGAVALLLVGIHSCTVIERERRVVLVAVVLAAKTNVGIVEPHLQSAARRKRSAVKVFKRFWKLNQVLLRKAVAIGKCPARNALNALFELQVGQRRICAILHKRIHVDLFDEAGD